jgi:hypothetical protein
MHDRIKALSGVENDLFGYRNAIAQWLREVVEYLKGDG